MSCRAVMVRAAEMTGTVSLATILAPFGSG
jgi:hypothetical protein